MDEVELSELPSSAEEGWLRGQEKVAKLPWSAQTGAQRERVSAKHKKVVLVKPIVQWTSTTPSAPEKDASRYFY